MIAEGSAYLDRSGRVLAAEAGFRSLLRLPDGDPSEALARRAQDEPRLDALLRGEGPDVVRLGARAPAPACELRRTVGAYGMLLRAWASEAGLAAPALELALHALVLTRLAGSVAHDVKNPLNAMALQLALLGDKIAAGSEALASACGPNLASLRNQVARVDDVIRRYVEVADPPNAGGFDAAGMLTDVVALFGHEARRRRLSLRCESQAGSVRAAGDQGRAARLLVGLLWRGIGATPEGGRLEARAAAGPGEARLVLEHEGGELDPVLAWVGPVVAAGASELGGRLDESTKDGRIRAALILPKERPL
jgi:signal transduction histidine kinase